jgi:hypothetical protein
MDFAQTEPRVSVLPARNAWWRKSCSICASLGFRELPLCLSFSGPVGARVGVQAY